MIKSDDIKELAAALSKAQSQIEPAVKSSENPGFKRDGKSSTYANLDDDWTAARQALTSNGLSVTQLVDHDEQGSALVTILMHSSGQFIGARHPIVPIKNDPQGFKSAITYARRTAFEAIVGLSAIEDDDGNEAQKAAQNNRQEPKKQEPQPAQTPVVVKPTNGAKPTCRLCNHEMQISKAGNGYYCPNFRDGKGEHSRFKKDELSAYLAAQSGPSFEDEEIPF